MKQIVFLTVTCLFIGCTNEKPDPYDHSNYTLVKTDSLHGHVGTEYFVFKTDPLRKLQIDYWDNGKLLAIAFTYKGKMDGKSEMYDYTGNLLRIDSFSNGEKVFEKIFYDRDTTLRLFKNGKFQPFTSIDSL